MGKIQKLKEQKKLEKIIAEIERKKRKKKLILIAVIILLLVIFIVAGIFYFKRTNRGKDIFLVTIETERGNIDLELNKKVAPKTVENFVKLAQEGFYDGTKFHRVVENFVVQGGDPLSKDNDPNNDGTGGPGYTFEDEINPRSIGVSEERIKELEDAGYVYNYALKSLPNKVGAIAMANSGPNTNGSQFFIITTQDQPHLNGLHTVFGYVIKGMDVVREIKQGDIIKRVIIIN